MVRVANQNQITIHKNDKHDNFVVLGWEDFQQVANLDTNSKSPLILYIYLLHNANGFVKMYSPQDMVNLYGKDKKTWERAFDTLKAAQFIIHNDDEADHNYHFYPSPQTEKVTINKDNCSFQQYIKLPESKQKQIYEELLEFDTEDDMNQEQQMIYDFYLRYLFKEDKD